MHLSSYDTERLILFLMLSLGALLIIGVFVVLWKLHKELQTIENMMARHQIPSEGQKLRRVK